VACWERGKESIDFGRGEKGGEAKMLGKVGGENVGRILSYHADLSDRRERRSMIRSPETLEPERALLE